MNAQYPFSHAGLMLLIVAGFIMLGLQHCGVV